MWTPDAVEKIIKEVITHFFIASAIYTIVVAFGLAMIKDD